jgi:LysR family transcriptional activator of nhaA
MRHLNYSHLQYFWAVAREGSIVAASEVLHVTPQTISGQLKLLEESVGQPLFDRSGRRLVLSEMGRVVYQYADEIFSIGAELANVVRGGRGGGPAILNVGMVSSMPKLIAERIIAPAVIDGREQGRPIRVRCTEAGLEQLLAELSIHRLDLVLSDQPAPSGLGFKAYNHRLGESGLSFFARKPADADLKRNFPESLNNAPMLLPSKHSALRRHMDEWFESRGIAPDIVGEFADSALMKAFGETGTGLFAAPTVIENEIRRMYRMSVIGRAEDMTESFYAISPERRLKHDAVVAITRRARDDLFAGDRGLEAVGS